MQKYFFVVFVILFLGTVFFALDVRAQSRGIYTATANLRDSAGMTNVLGVILKGTEAQILDEQDGWYQVLVDGQGLKGWTASWLIEKREGQVSAVQASGKNTVLLHNSNVRETPVIQTGNIVDVFTKGTIVQTNKEENGWSYVSYRGKEMGWIASWLLEEATATSHSGGTLEKAQVKAAQNEESTSLGMLQYNSNVRTAPMGTVIEVLSLGSHVDILNEENGWYEISYQQSKTGWVASWLVKEGGNLQASVLPGGLDGNALNQYALLKINTLRAQAGLQQLQIDQQFVDTATEWAKHIGAIGVITHTRPDGSSMHGWIDSKGLAFTERYSQGGWQTNYFTENIGVQRIALDQKEAEAAIDEMIQYYLSEASWNGPHYRTIYHPDWNSVGLGFSVVPISGDRYKMYAVFHYGSLER